MIGGVLGGLYALLLASHVAWLVFLAFGSIYAVVLTAFGFLIWPLGQIAGLAGAVFLKEDDRPMGAVILLAGMVGANLLFIRFGLAAVI